MKKSKVISVTSSRKAYNLARGYISTDQEEVWVLCLSTLKHPLSLRRLFMGTLDSCTFHPREVFKTCIEKKGHSFILFHSHPSGSFEPSEEDDHLTAELSKASDFMKISFLDHIIVSVEGYYSYRDEGFMAQKLF